MSLSRLAVLPLALAVLPAAPAQAAPVNVPATLEKLHLADEECEDYDAPHMREARQMGKLDAHHTLYLLPCYIGAYNMIYRVYTLDARYPDAVRAELLAAFSDQLGWYGRSGVINAEYDEAKRTLTAFEKGRGLGDCGSQPTWQWTEYGWRLIEYRYWDKCDGSRMPADWPVIYRYTPPK